MAFTLRRGAEDSAPKDLLKFDVTIDRLEEDKLYFRFIFENPSKVSIGTLKDVIIATVLDVSFFCSADSEKTIE